MKTRDNSWPAFPVEINGLQYTGLSKREYFAAIAMQGIVSTDSGMRMPDADVARISRTLANAMLKELGYE